MADDGKEDGKVIEISSHRKVQGEIIHGGEHGEECSGCSACAGWEDESSGLPDIPSFSVSQEGEKTILNLYVPMSLWICHDEVRIVTR